MDVNNEEIEERNKSKKDLTTRASVIPRTVGNRRNAMLPDNNENFGCNDTIQNKIIDKLNLKEKRNEKFGLIFIFIFTLIIMFIICWYYLPSDENMINNLVYENIGKIIIILLISLLTYRLSIISNESQQIYFKCVDGEWQRKNKKLKNEIEELNNEEIKEITVADTNTKNILGTIEVKDNNDVLEYIKESSKTLSNNN